MLRIVKKRRRSEPVIKPRDMDAIIEISPLAIMAIVALGFDVLGVARALPGVAYRAAVAYTAGLVAIGRRATAARINRILGGVSHDSLTRLREQDYVYVPSLILAFIRIVHMPGTPGYLCLDDTFIPHERSKKMDGVYWYASKENMKLIVKELKLEFATRLKKNARLMWNGRRLQTRTIGKRLLAGARAYRRNGTLARATQVVVGELGAMTFVVTTDDLDGQMTHIALCFAGIVALDAMRNQTGLALGQAVEAARRLVFARTPSGEYELVSLAPAPNGALADLDDAKRVVADALDAVSQLRLPEGSHARAAA